MSGTSDCVTIKILFFARARELTGEKESIAYVPRRISARNLLSFICEKYNLNSTECNVVLALNERWVDLNCDLNLNDTDEVAIVPPLSGEFGAVSIFVGTTRNNFEGKIVTKLEYEAFEEMAAKSLENICKTIRRKYDIGNIAIFHRLGDVPTQEASVIIAISSSHRQPALEAVPYAINALKAEVPIWKKEVYEDGLTPEWKENPESNDLISTDNENRFQLYEEIVVADSENDVPPHLIQINANLQEINRRINSFVNRKRQQINVSNVQDFCLDAFKNAEESTCARVSAVLMRRKDSKSHLKVHRVENKIGPQTQSNDQSSLSFHDISFTPNCPSGAEERLSNAEEYLGINQSSRDVFSRLKAIEDRILYLESISPEYFDFKRRENQKQKVGNWYFKKTYSSTELNQKLQALETKLRKKSSGYL